MFHYFISQQMESGIKQCAHERKAKRTKHFVFQLCSFFPLPSLSLKGRDFLWNNSQPVHAWRINFRLPFPGERATLTKWRKDNLFSFFHKNTNNWIKLRVLRVCSYCVSRAYELCYSLNFLKLVLRSIKAEIWWLFSLRTNNRLRRIQ